MSALDWIPDYDWWDGDGYDEEVTCRYCGKEWLEWEQTEHGWRLFDANGDVHNCRRQRNADEELETLDD